MTESLLQKLEEKMMALFSELEVARKELDEARKEIMRLHYENVGLNTDKQKNTEKLQYLLSLLDAVHETDSNAGLVQTQVTGKPVLVQG